MTKNLIDNVNYKLALEYHTPNDMKNVDKSNAEFVIVEFMKNEERYKLWCGGPFCNRFLSLKQIVDAIIHMIFLGIIKATQQLISLWIKGTKGTLK